jgi:hypothetical protein
MSSATRNPWVALNVTADPVAHARALARAHERALSGDRLPPSEIRELVLDSWSRSLAAGAQPGAEGAPIRFASEELEARRANSPLAPAVDAILSILSHLDHDARHIVAISDADANLLWVHGDPVTLDQARQMHFEEGAAWSEAAVGTNAVGTAAALDHALQIFSAEHLLPAVHAWTCSAAPIHDPDSGELIGVVDLTAELRTNHPHTLSLALLAARTAETTLRLHSLELAARLRERWEAEITGRRAASALLDPRGRVIASRGVQGPVHMDAGVELQPLEGGAAIAWFPSRRRRQPRLRLRFLGHGASARLDTARTERGLRSLELLAVLAMHPEGLSAEQLALALYGERGKTVTVRAQVHRVRASLGEHVLDTQPYRLLAAIDADWTAVEELVKQGRSAEALAAYPGPLLPASDAPEIVDARGLLEESLRRSVLTSADPDLLAQWLAHPAGRDDLAAARTLVAVLEPGDPKRAAATATSAAIARRMAAT